ncbi:hypothetical protein GCM10009839_07140 [Catenulispora yoronensis]|uniref:Uncharacterized protein n=1 Tax=Catenulispora yoronensis TaxID=450799 RepID=A0ABN2TP16_9ACTN
MSVFTSIDLTGYTQREGEQVWIDDRGIVVSLHYFDLVPNLPAPLRDVDRLRAELARRTAEAGAGLIQAEVGNLDGVPSLFQLVKVPRPNGQGQAFIGSYTIPKDTCSAVIKAQASEGEMTGMREAIILDRVGPQQYFQQHPYAPEINTGLPYHAADRPEFDAEFPDHPLSLLRRELSRIFPTLRVDPRFGALPPFAGE